MTSSMCNTKPQLNDQPGGLPPHLRRLLAVAAAELAQLDKEVIPEAGILARHIMAVLARYRRIVMK